MLNGSAAGHQFLDNSSVSPLIVIIVFPMHSLLSLLQRLRKAASKTRVRYAARSAPTAGSGGVMRINTHSAVSRSYRRNRFSPSHIRSLSRGSRRRRFSLCCCRLCRCGRAVGHWLRTGPGGCRWWWRRRRRFGCRCNLFFEIRFWRPALNRRGHVHTQPPS